MKLRAATRGSPLALWQTSYVAALLQPLGIEVEPVIVKTFGDQDQTSPLHTIGGQGVFVKEVQHAVLNHRANFAVHSLKDLQISLKSLYILFINSSSLLSVFLSKRKLLLILLSISFNNHVLCISIVLFNSILLFEFIIHII